MHDDPDWVADVVRRLTDRHEADRAKFKLSQNRPPADIDGVIDGPRRTGDHAGASAVQRHRP